MGYIGNNGVYCDPGYFYAPYIPQTTTPIVAFGMSRHDGVQFRAWELWKAAGEPHGQSDHFWRQALEELTAEIQLAIEQNLPPDVICRPAHGRGDYDYFTKPENNAEHPGILFARAQIADNCRYELQPTAYALAHIQENTIFDLNDPTEIDRLMATLSTMVVSARKQAEQAAAGHPVLQDQATMIDPSSFTPSKGILTRYGQKLLTAAAKFYGTINVKSP
jgi:hypothetical protein